MAGGICSIVKGVYVAPLLEKGLKVVSNSDGGGGQMCYILDKEVLVDKEGFVEWVANRRILVPSLSPSMKNRIQHMHY